MKWVSCHILCVLLFFPVALAQEDAGDAARMPARPVQHVLDGARWLNPAEKEVIQEELSALFMNHDVDIYLVTRSSLPAQGAEAYTRTLGKAWARSPVWAVVFQVPGDPAGFHVEVGGTEINQAFLEQSVKEALRRARRELTEKDRAMAAWRECAETLRHVHASKQRVLEQHIEKQDQQKAKNQNHEWRKGTLIAVGAIGGVLLMTVVFLIVWRVRSRASSYEFPDTSWRMRYKAPHSGGSGIVVNYRGKRLN